MAASTQTSDLLSTGSPKGGVGQKKGTLQKEKMPVLVLLRRSGLEEIYPLFEQAGYQMLDANFHPNDLQVEQIIGEVERQYRRRFPRDLRLRIWKALRYMWFQGAGHDNPFIERNEVPHLFLPKRDYKQIDWNVKFSDLDPDRQRQIVRKKRRSTKQVGGPEDAHFGDVSVEELQFEVYRRQPDIWYEFQDLKRSVQEWSRGNPRLMLREDPREEVLKMRIRSVMERSTQNLARRTTMNVRQRLILHILLGIRIVAGVLAILMFFVAYMRFRNSPGRIVMSFIMGCKQFIAGITYIIAFAFAWVVSQRQRDDPHIMRFRTLIVSCERLIEHIGDFRVESEELRMTKSEAPKPREVRLASLPPQPQKQLKRRKRKKPKDPMMMLWAPQLVRNKDNVESIGAAMPATYKALDPLPDSFRREGGERMWKFKDRFGNRLAGVSEDRLGTRVLGREQDTRYFLAFEQQLPLPPSYGPSAQLRDHAEMPDLPALTHTERPLLALPGQLTPTPSSPMGSEAHLEYLDEMALQRWVPGVMPPSPSGTEVPSAVPPSSSAEEPTRRLLDERAP